MFPQTNEYFYKNKRAKDGFTSWCVFCRRKKQLQYIENNKEKVTKSRHDWHKKNKDKVNEKCRNWRKENPERKKRNETAFYERNPTKHREYADKHLKKRHNITDEEWDSCKLYFNYGCAYCGMSYKEHKEQIGQDLHREHVDDKGASDLSNCVPSCRECNSHKWIFPLDKWYTDTNAHYDEGRLERIHKWLNGDFKHYLKTQ